MGHPSIHPSIWVLILQTKSTGLVHFLLKRTKENSARWAGFGQSWLFSLLVGISHGLTMSQNWSNPAHSVVHGLLPGLGISHFPFPFRVFWASSKRKLPYVVYSFIYIYIKCIYISSLHFLEIIFVQILNLKTFQQILYHPLSGYYCEVIYGGGFMWGLKSGLPRLVKSVFISKEFVQP